MALGLLAVMAGLLAASETAAQAVREGLALCGGSVIPALFPFLVVSRLFVATGSAAALGRLLAPLTRRMLGVSGPGGTAVLLGLLGGYPVGAQTAGELVRTGAVSRQEGQRLLLFCNNCGPAFALGVAGVGCFGSLRAGAWLWLIHVSAAVLTALLTRHTSYRRDGLRRLRRCLWSPPFRGLSGERGRGCSTSAASWCSFWC